ncbi:MAG TPA: 16S rRNA (cytidine(1402)-2'-O)-methyltransferase [Thermoanaerobaculia bacterium]|nr:16S rRNA (cytidine(1402)-2'-O)-methyltransferase [Thermoanaerobaculia bacterium]
MAAGKLLLIGTPIGNLGDLSPRALDALRSCDTLLCEDTRHTGKLLAYFGVQARLESFHDFNEDQKTDRVIERIAGGETIALVSDAGMPVLSDPGFPLIRRARLAGLAVEPIPGPFAAALALAASGLPPLPFAFFGFVPHRSAERRELYRRLAALEMTVVVYESAERILESLADARLAFGDADMTLAREMTKLHEELVHGTIGEVIDRLSTRERIRGEITLVIAAPAIAAVEADPERIRDEFHRLRNEGVRRPDAAKILAERYRLRKSDLYRMLLDEDG